MVALVVDDEELVIGVVANILKRYGYRVLRARSVADARRIYSRRSLRLTLVVSDIQMPGGSGLELSHELAALRPELPVLLMSGGYRDSDPLIRSHLRPGRVFLEKPFSERTFLARLSRLRPSADDGAVAVPASGK